MNTSDFLIISSFFIALATLRFGVPILLMWLMRVFCTRVLHEPL